jgi:isochorismate hydrolase
MYLPQTLNILQQHHQRNQILLIGIEAHVCILQTCLDFLANQYQVFLPIDAVTSVRNWERTIALERMSKEGAILTTFESAVFDLLKDASDEKFKPILNIIK